MLKYIDKSPDSRSSIFFFLMFTLRERGSIHVHEAQRGRERRRERIPSRLWSINGEPDTGLDPMTVEIIT